MLGLCCCWMYIVRRSDLSWRWEFLPGIVAWRFTKVRKLNVFKRLQSQSSMKPSNYFLWKSWELEGRSSALILLGKPWSQDILACLLETPTTITQGILTYTEKRKPIPNDFECHPLIISLDCSMRTKSVAYVLHFCKYWTMNAILSIWFCLHTYACIKMSHLVFYQYEINQFIIIIIILSSHSLHMHILRAS